jgi:mevalonate kinase
MFVGRGHGKLILCGEHAVVYGHPALAMAVDRGTTVRLTPRPGTLEARGDIVDDRLIPALRTVLPADGWQVDIATDLPVGRGMGSSAALAVALIRAESASRGHTPSVDEVFERAFAVERVFHGNPSGLDHAVSARGGLLRYRRGPPPSFEPLPLPSWRLVVLDSGVAGDTKQLVAGVASRRPTVDADLDRIGELVLEATAALDDPQALGPLLTENHGLLRRIGVSTPQLDDLVALALKAGAVGAKLAGAGGGGVVLALVEDPEPVLRAAAAAGVPAFPTRPVP